MRVITAAEIDGALTFRDLVETLRSAFRADIETPVRHHHTIARPDGADATLLLMPAWNDFAAQGHSQRGYIGVKILSVFPDNGRISKPSIMGTYMLMSGQSGGPLAVLDGPAITLWRTAAASALAASYLAREDSKRHPDGGSGHHVALSHPRPCRGSSHFGSAGLEPHAGHSRTTCPSPRWQRRTERARNG